MPITAWVTRSPAYTSPSALRTLTSVTKSAMVRTISATRIATRAAAHAPRGDPSGQRNARPPEGHRRPHVDVGQRPVPHLESKTELHDAEALRQPAVGQRALRRDERPATERPCPRLDVALPREDEPD